MAERMRTGIPMPRPTLAALRAEARRLGVEGDALAS